MGGVKNKAEPLVLLLEGQKLATQGKFTQALAWLQKGLSIAKGTRNKRAQSLIHSEIGLCYHEKGNRKEALKEFAMAHHVWPDCSSSLLTLGTASVSGRYPVQAGVGFLRLLATNHSPRNPSV